MTVRRGPISDLSGVQRDILAVVAKDGPVDRFAIKKTIQQERLDRVPNATVYNHLERLCDEALIEKCSGQHSGGVKSNKYRIARDGLKTLSAHRRWLDECLDDANLIVEAER